MDHLELKHFYLDKKFSVKEISSLYKCSEHRVNYWLNKFSIPKRTISDAIYLKRNPSGDPFKVKQLTTPREMFLFGLGLGLYWGEGTKASLTSVRLGNSNPHLIKNFLLFLENCYGIDKNKLKFGLQIFNDVNPDSAYKFWIRFLKMDKKQFQKPVISNVRGAGTYSNKAPYGVLTIYFNNKKLRDILYGEIEKLSKI